MWQDTLLAANKSHPLHEIFFLFYFFCKSGYFVFKKLNNLRPSSRPMSRCSGRSAISESARRSRTLRMIRSMFLAVTPGIRLSIV